MRKKIIIIAIIISVSLSLFIINNLFFDCKEEQYLFIDQYLGNFTTSEYGYDNCTECLEIVVFSTIDNKTRTFYFPFEHELTKFERFNEINIRWCQTPYGRRIRGIYK